MTSAAQQAANEKYQQTSAYKEYKKRCYFKKRRDTLYTMYPRLQYLLSQAKTLGDLKAIIKSHKVEKI
jgi:hypothetical protein